MSGVVYLDSSALLKLVIEEPESVALRRSLRPTDRLATCALARTEVLRSVASQGEAARAAVRQLLTALDIVALDETLLDVAATLTPPAMRTPDAIHLAAALAFGDE